MRQALSKDFFRRFPQGVETRLAAVVSEFKGQRIMESEPFSCSGHTGKAKPGSADTEEKFREAAGIVFGGAKCIFPMGGRRPNWRILLHLLKVE